MAVWAPAVPVRGTARGMGGRPRSPSFSICRLKSCSEAMVPEVGVEPTRGCPHRCLSASQCPRLSRCGGFTLKTGAPFGRASADFRGRCCCLDLDVDQVADPAAEDTASEEYYKHGARFSDARRAFVTAVRSECGLPASEIERIASRRAVRGPAASTAR